MEQRQYMVFNTSEINMVNFAEVLQTSANTLVKTVDGTKTFVKWEKPAASVEYQLQYEVDEDGMPYQAEQTSITAEDSNYIPSSIAALTTKEGPFTQAEMKTLLSRPEWTNYDFNNRA